MQKVIHRASSRGFADHGWLKSAHSFSFASYYDAERMGFGLLRVLNDDFVAAGKGFDTHPHKDMEIVSIPLKGALHHKDSEGHEQIIQHGEVQIMSAGTGVSHSEYNASATEEVNFLQIWIMPEHKAITPRYDQKKFTASDRHNKIQAIVSPLHTSGGGIQINQQAYFSLLDLEEGREISYAIKSKNNGVYLFVLEGDLEVLSERLGRRDAIGVSHVDQVCLKAFSALQLLIIDVPMQSS